MASSRQHYMSSTFNSKNLSIIAVHGLGANPEYAWIRKVGEGRVNWLRDQNMLPAKITNARIMTFNYESSWLKDAPKQRRSICADQLLSALDNMRKEVRTGALQILTVNK